ncbi:MAG: hypothetical protein ACK44H_01510 [Candidatus Kryptonium sp.]
MAGKILKLGILFSFIFVVGCGPNYLPALWDSAPPMSAPTEVRKETTFLSAYYNSTGGFNSGDENKFFRANLVKAIGGSWYKFSGGGFAYLGNYNVQNAQEVEPNRGEKSYFGVGADIDVNIFLPLHLFNVGIGTYSGVAGEFGSYTSFRKSREGKSEISPIFDEIVPFLSGYTFLQFNFSKSDNLTVRAGMGLPGGYFLNLGYYNINYGGFWVGWSATETDTGSEFGVTSAGFSIKIK